MTWVGWRSSHSGRLYRVSAGPMSTNPRHPAKGGQRPRAGTHSVTFSHVSFGGLANGRISVEIARPVRVEDGADEVRYF